MAAAVLRAYMRGCAASVQVCHPAPAGRYMRVEANATHMVHQAGSGGSSIALSCAAAACCGACAAACTLCRLPAASACPCASVQTVVIPTCRCCPLMMGPCWTNSHSPSRPAGASSPALARWAAAAAALARGVGCWAGAAATGQRRREAAAGQLAQYAVGGPLLPISRCAACHTRCLLVAIPGFRCMPCFV